MFLFGDSFDHYVTADITKKWTQTAGGTNGNCTIGAFGRRSSQGVKFNHNSFVGTGQSKYLSYTINNPGPTGATIIAGFAFKPTVLADFGAGTAEENSIFAIRYLGATQLWFRLNTTGTISCYRGATLLGTTTSNLSNGTYAYVEFKVLLSTTVGTVAVRFNEVLDATLNLTGQNTRNGAADLFDEVRVGPFVAANSSVIEEATIDDFWLADGSGADGWNDFMGDMQVDANRPNANGNYSQFTRSTGADQYATLDETLHNSDTDYNETAVVNNIDTVNVAAAPVVGGTIKCVQLIAVAKKADSGTALHKGVVRIGGTDYLGSLELGMTDTYGCLRQPLALSPATGIAWTEAEFNAAEFGYKKTA